MKPIRNRYAFAQPLTVDEATLLFAADWLAARFACSH
jgi:hypothetical protein